MMIVLITCFLLAGIPVSAVKTAEQSIGDSHYTGEPVYRDDHRVAEFILLPVDPTHLLHDR